LISSHSRPSLDNSDRWSMWTSDQSLVEAAGQLFHLFRDGLDYAFIPLPGCGACYPPRSANPSARSTGIGVSESMSLYRAGLRLALFLPLGVVIPRLRLRVHRCEPRFHFALTGKGDHCVNRTRVRKSSAFGSTCLSASIYLTACYPMGRENTRRVR
jgi:hypothetical protein